MRLPEEPDLPAQINLVPMVDIVFALLTFFIMSSLVLTRSEGLPINLPQANTAKLQTRKQVVVSIAPGGKIAINQTSTSLKQLTQQLQVLLQSQQESIVVINADEQVNHGRVVAVMDQIRKIQGARLAIATKPEKQN